MAQVVDELDRVELEDAMKILAEPGTVEFRDGKHCPDCGVKGRCFSVRTDRRYRRCPQCGRTFRTAEVHQASLDLLIAVIREFAPAYLRGKEGTEC